MERKQIMKKTMVVMVLCTIAAAAAAQEWTTTVDLSYTSRYIWRGYDILDNAGAFQPSIDLSHESGFGASVWMSYPERGGWTNDLADSRVNLTEYDYTVYYKGQALTGDAWETNYKIGWRYYDYIDTSSKAWDKQEVFVEAAMPKLTGNAVVPHVAVYQMWPSKSDMVNTFKSGTIYVMGFDYLLPTEEQIPNLPLTFSWDLVFNDGVASSDHDWSHMVWGLKTQMDCPMTGGKIVPAVYFQNSFEDTVNTSDEFWATVSYSFTF